MASMASEDCLAEDDDIRACLPSFSGDVRCRPDADDTGAFLAREALSIQRLAVCCSRIDKPFSESADIGAVVPDWRYSFLCLNALIPDNR